MKLDSAVLLVHQFFLLQQGIAMKEPVTLPLGSLNEEPYGSILCYPKHSEDELQDRLRELEMHGVTAVEFAGKANALNVPVLGKGYVGIVVIAQRYGQRLALKVRRVDADRADLLHEAKMLSKANSAGVGPTMIDASKNFLLMQLIEGDLLPAWLEANRDTALLRQVLGEVMEQCWQLDLVGLDHGELSKAPKHVIIDPHQQPWIVDFETSSDCRKPANVTAICQYLTMSGGPISRTISGILGERKRGEVIEALRNYKKEKTRESLDQLIQACFY
jgi:putative serine/threonine protein kinase